MSDAPLAVLSDPVRAQRFWSNVDQSGGPEACWLWKRAATGSGYGVNRCGSGGVSFTTMAHRVAWILNAGRPVPGGAQIDHMCMVRACCNPRHLRPVTPSENVRASSHYRAGTAEIVRVSPSTFRVRNGRRHEIWREYLADGNIRQAGRVVEAC